jgi:hypothetical protein
METLARVLARHLTSQSTAVGVHLETPTHANLPCIRNCSSRHVQGHIAMHMMTRQVRLHVLEEPTM